MARISTRNPKAAIDWARWRLTRQQHSLRMMKKYNMAQSMIDNQQLLVDEAQAALEVLIERHKADGT